MVGMHLVETGAFCNSEWKICGVLSLAAPATVRSLDRAPPGAEFPLSLAGSQM